MTQTLEKSLLITSDKKQEDIQKKKLQRLIQKKRKILLTRITKTELLKVELEMVKQEYDMRVGKLYLKSNQQDLDIIYYNNLLQLLEDGISYEEAIKQVDGTYYAQQRKLDQEKEQLRNEQEIYEKRNEMDSQHSHQDIKSLWIFLVGKFHPDLVQDPVEKKRREEIMKQINRAYEEHDYNRLKQLEADIHIETYEETTVEKLSTILVDIENEIIQQDLMYQELRTSVWFGWKTKIEQAKKRNIDIFSDIEFSLLNEITQKISVIENLKNLIQKIRT